MGAGPGDAELLTLKALRALRNADVILYDDLVAPEILDYARREARTMLVGKTGHGPSCRQDDINALMVQLARSGKQVVRLKSGDPLVFGRAGEEIEACRAAGIPVTVVPGVSAAQGAAAALGLSLTHRDAARRLQFVTGHDRRGAPAGRPELGRARRSQRHHGGLHAQAHPAGAARPRGGGGAGALDSGAPRVQRHPPEPAGPAGHGRRPRRRGWRRPVSTGRRC